MWLTDTFSILWLLGNGKAGATAKNLWGIWMYTVDPVGAKHITKTNFEKNNSWSDNKMDYCDYFVTYKEVVLG